MVNNTLFSFKLLGEYTALDRSSWANSSNLNRCFLWIFWIDCQVKWFKEIFAVKFWCKHTYRKLTGFETSQRTSFNKMIIPGNILWCSSIERFWGFKGALVGRMTFKRLTVPTEWIESIIEKSESLCLGKAFVFFSFSGRISYHPIMWWGFWSSQDRYLFRLVTVC